MSSSLSSFFSPKCPDASLSDCRRLTATVRRLCSPLIVVISSRTEVISAKILSMLVLKSVAESASPIVEVAMAMRRCTARRMAAAVGRRGETQERSRRRIKRIDTR